jgi:hypothetical protein
MATTCSSAATRLQIRRGSGVVFVLCLIAGQRLAANPKDDDAETGTGARNQPPTESPGFPLPLGSSACRGCERALEPCVRNARVAHLPI